MARNTRQLETSSALAKENAGSCIVKLKLPFKPELKDPLDKLDTRNLKSEVGQQLGPFRNWKF